METGPQFTGWMADVYIFPPSGLTRMGHLECCLGSSDLDDLIRRQNVRNGVYGSHSLVSRPGCLIHFRSEMATDLFMTFILSPRLYSSVAGLSGESQVAFQIEGRKAILTEYPIFPSIQLSDSLALRFI